MFGDYETDDGSPQKSPGSFFGTGTSKVFQNMFQLFVSGTCLSYIFVVELYKTRSFPIKTRVIWVPGEQYLGFN